MKTIFHKTLRELIGILIACMVYEMVKWNFSLNGLRLSSIEVDLIAEIGQL